jgi:hypothetical protein
MFMQASLTNLEDLPTSNETALTKPEGKELARPVERGAIGIAFLVWLLGGGLGLALLVFVLLKIF